MVDIEIVIEPIFTVSYLSKQKLEPLMSGYSGTPLPKKLGLKSGQAALLLGVPREIAEVRNFSGFTYVRKSMRNLSGRQFDYVHLFVKKRGKLEATIPQIRSLLKPDGMMWISWAKRSSGVKTDITEGVLRDVILPYGLVDVKVCAIDVTWSGLKFMFRKEVRPNL